MAFLASFLLPGLMGLFSRGATNPGLAASSAQADAALAQSNIQANNDMVSETQFYTAMGRKQRQFSVGLDSDAEDTKEAFMLQNFAITTDTAEKQAIQKLEQQATQ